VYRKFVKYVLLLAGVYAAYVVTGMVLTGTNVVDKWVVAPNTIIASDKYEQNRDASTRANDGPHVFYAKDQVIIKSIINRDTTVALSIDTIAIADKAAFSLNCTFSEHPEWNFSTQFKDTLRDEPAEYTSTDSLVAISDIEGNFDAFRRLLTASKVMSNDYRWTFGTGHLVLLGDFFDRGLHVTECLWLIYHLEQEAEKAGGKVHFILGNHDIMNMGNDLRYVRKKYFENAVLLEVHYPDLFKSDTELGRWLQTKNIAEKIGDMLFVHGGFSQEVNDLSLSLPQMSDLCRPHYCTDNNVRRETFTEPLKTLYSSQTSPFWYRGYVQEDASEEQIDQTLMMYDANAIVIGHTLVDNVASLYDGKIIAIDTKHADNNSQALLYSGNKLYRIDSSGRRRELQKL
jgi:hypothetical protein